MIRKLKSGDYRPRPEFHAGWVIAMRQCEAICRNEGLHADLGDMSSHADAAEAPLVTATA